jgi:hypothetical protein
MVDMQDSQTVYSPSNLIVYDTYLETISK